MRHVAQLDGLLKTTSIAKSNSFWSCSKYEFLMQIRYVFKLFVFSSLDSGSHLLTWYVLLGLSVRRYPSNYRGPSEGVNSIVNGLYIVRHELYMPIAPPKMGVLAHCTQVFYKLGRCCYRKNRRREFFWCLGSLVVWRINFPLNQDCRRFHHGQLDSRRSEGHGLPGLRWETSGRGFGPPLRLMRIGWAFACVSPPPGSVGAPPCA